MGTVCWRGEGAGPAGSVALRCPTDGVARRPLEVMETMMNSKCGGTVVVVDRSTEPAWC